MQSIRPNVEPVPILCSPAYAKSARDGGRHWVRRPSGVGAGAGRKGAHIPETGHGKCWRNRDAGCCRGTEEHRHWSWGDRGLPGDEGACLDLQAELGVLHAAAGILCTCAVVGFWVVDATEASTVDARGRKHTHTQTPESQAGKARVQETVHSEVGGAETFPAASPWGQKQK